MAIEFDLNTGIIRNMSATATKTTDTLETPENLAYLDPITEPGLSLVEIETTSVDSQLAARQAAFKYFLK